MGFAFDGNPIYGPYGYTTNTGGAVTQMRSGYILDLKSGRLPLSNFPEGFFIEDYTHKKTTDASALDENNGRFGVTPEYPNGTYAYFMTVNNLQTEESGVLKNIKNQFSLILLVKIIILFQMNLILIFHQIKTTLTLQKMDFVETPIH